MKIKDRSNYKPGPKDECSTPPYGIMPVLIEIEAYRRSIGINDRKDFLIWEPAMGMDRQRPQYNLSNGLKGVGYSVVGETCRDFITAPIPDGVNLIMTNPPFSVSLKRQFIKRCELLYHQHNIPYALLMSATTLCEKINGRILRGCSIHVPNGRICFGMPNKGWGTVENPTKATFETMWYSKGLCQPRIIHYSNFDMSEHFKALGAFEDAFLHTHLGEINE